MRSSKRDVAARWARGFTWALRFLPSRPVLLVFNYHRIGTAEKYLYDSETFSATPAELDRQIAFLKRRWHIADLAEVMDIAEGKAPLRHATALITFDDGYLDNYELAFPILASHAVSGVFFVSTSYIGSIVAPWWDMAAYILKTSARRLVKLEYLGASYTIDLDRTEINCAVRRVLAIHKNSAEGRSDEFIAALERACGSSRPPAGTRFFISWDELRKMCAAGMSIGSHGHSHDILSKLSAGEQFEDVKKSKELLEEQLASTVESLAYPVGLRGTFSAETRRAVESAQFRVCFSFYGGFNLPGSIDRYDIRRVAVANPPADRFALQTTLGMLTGKYWF